MNKKQARIEALKFVTTWSREHILAGHHCPSWNTDAENAKIESALENLVDELQRKIDRSEAQQ